MTIGLAALALTACSASGGTSSSTAGSVSTKTKGDITIWYRPGSIPTSSVNGVKKAFPNVTFHLLQSANVDAKVTAALRAGTGLPDITTGDPVVYAQVASKFVNLGENGFTPAVAKTYVSWKVKLGQTPSGEQIGVPIDIGPEAFYYNATAFKAAGLPTDPSAVGKLVSTWSGYEKLAEQVKAAGKFACDDPSYLFKYLTWSKSALFYKQSGGSLIYNPVSSVVKDAFTKSMDFENAGLCADVQPYTTDWASSVSQGDTIAFINPPWVGAGLLSTTAPKQSGQWRVATATPGGYGAEDGSELVVPKTSANPKLATLIAIWLTNAANMSSGFTHNGLFPSTIASYSSAALTKGQPYFGGQKVGSLLGTFAEKAPSLPKGVNTNGIDTVYQNEIVNAETSKLSSADAYKAALAKAEAQFGN
ncbi:MAG TPA: ABC transporter substrate-binding protein [Galbitalea sp.]|jgi:cellobiose transport system substrate-binding protein|nr:ABC transporter substrate-binding protein [Galbitalea sp.]